MNAEMLHGRFTELNQRFREFESTVVCWRRDQRAEHRNLLDRIVALEVALKALQEQQVPADVARELTRQITRQVMQMPSQGLVRRGPESPRERAERLEVEAEDEDSLGSTGRWKEAYRLACERANKAEAERDAALKELEALRAWAHRVHDVARFPPPG